MAEKGKDILKAADLLSKNALVSIPTETVYGLAGNALHVDAVLKIFEVKNRPSFDPLIVHISKLSQLENLVSYLPDNARTLAAKFWPGPMTLLLEKQSIIPDIVTAGLPTVAIRIPDHPLTLELLSILAFPLAAPSANPFGYVSPTTAQHVDDQLGDKLSYILDGGPCQIGIESTIIGFSNETPVIYRLGGKSIEDIEKVAGKVLVKKHSSSQPGSPGTLSSHYSPNKVVKLGDLTSFHGRIDLARTGLLRFKEYVAEFPKENQVVLAHSGELKEAAKNLFAAMRDLDRMDVDQIVAELLPEEGLGRAINDRLRRAASSA